MKRFVSQLSDKRWPRGLARGLAIGAAVLFAAVLELAGCTEASCEELEGQILDPYVKCGIEVRA